MRLEWQLPFPCDPSIALPRAQSDRLPEGIGDRNPCGGCYVSTETDESSAQRSSAPAVEGGGHTTLLETRHAVDSSLCHATIVPPVFEEAGTLCSIDLQKSA